MSHPVPTLLLTRPDEASRRFLALCEGLAGRPLPAILSPVMVLTPRAVTLPERPSALVLTSEAGAESAGALGLAGLPAWCVGPRTAQVAREAGLLTRDAGGNAEALVATILAARPSGLLLHLHGEHVRGCVAARLRAGGLRAEAVVAYAQDALPPTAQARAALGGPLPVVAPLFSPRSVHLLLAWHPRAPLQVVAMSGAVAEAARALEPRRLLVAARPDAPAMARAVVALLDGARLEEGGPAD